MFRKWEGTSACLGTVVSATCFQEKESEVCDVWGTIVGERKTQREVLDIVRWELKWRWAVGNDWGWEIAKPGYSNFRRKRGTVITDE